VDQGQGKLMNDNIDDMGRGGQSLSGFIVHNPYGWKISDMPKSKSFFPAVIGGVF